MDFVLYGELGLVAIEVKRSSRYREQGLAGLRVFGDDYPMARRFLFYGGDRDYEIDGIRVVPLARALLDLPTILGGR